MNPESLIGQKFGRLTIISLEPGIKSRTIAVCSCDCGKKHRAYLSNIKSANGTKSCGCLNKENVEKQKLTFKAGSKWRNHNEFKKPNEIGRAHV